MDQKKLLHLIREKSITLNISPQILQQNYMMERFLKRVSLSKYKDNTILKGGLLIANIVGLSTRATQDIDVTLQSMPMTEPDIKLIVTEVIDVIVDDNVSFELINTTKIREEADYEGYRCSLLGKQGTMKIPFKIDFSTGDTITPGATDFSYHCMIGNETIELLSYNLETVLAEKLQTCLARSITNTRLRDYYDIYILWCIHKENINIDTLSDALKATTKQRGTESDLSNSRSLMGSIKTNKEMSDHWTNYQGNFDYAKEISFSETVKTIESILELIIAK